MGKQPALGCTMLGLSLHSRIPPVMPAPLPLHAACSALLTCSSRLPNTCPQVKQHILSGTSATPWAFSSQLGAVGFSGRTRKGCAQAAPQAALQGAEPPGSLLSHPKKPVAEGASGTLGCHREMPIYPPPRQLPWPSSGVITQAELGTEVDTSSAK